MDERLAGLVGLARRAGRLTAGSDAVKALLAAGKAQAVLLAQDVSPKTEKEMRFAAKGAVPFLTVGLSKDEIGHAIGSQKPVGVVATEDKGFAGALLGAAAPNEEDAI